MTAKLPTSPVGRDAVDVSSRPALTLHREVLLATDASPAATAATRVVAALAARWQVTPNVCTVLPPPSLAMDPVGANVVYSPLLDEALRLEVARQLEASAPEA